LLQRPRAADGLIARLGADSSALRGAQVGQRLIVDNTLRFKEAQPRLQPAKNVEKRNYSLAQLRDVFLDNVHRAALFNNLRTVSFEVAVNE
jgi:hypothetical protein